MVALDLLVVSRCPEAERWVTGLTVDLESVFPHSHARRI
jgi:hypothetical protein